MTAQEKIISHLGELLYPTNYATLAEIGGCTVRYASFVARCQCDVQQLSAMVRLRWSRYPELRIFPVECNESEVEEWCRSIRAEIVPGTLMPLSDR